MVVPFPPPPSPPRPPISPHRPQDSPLRPVGFPPARPSLVTVPPPRDQYFAYLFHVCTVDCKGRPYYVPYAVRRAAHWFRPHSAASARLDAIGRLDIQVS